MLTAIQSELAAIMEPVGFGFEWRSLERVSGRDVAVGLVVVNFKGVCDGNAIPRNRVSSGALGWAHISDGQVLPFADIDCDRIRAFLKTEMSLLRSPHREEVFGHAVGRVLAHEMYHMLSRSLHHGAAGVAKPIFTPFDLTAPELRFDSREMALLRHSTAFAALEIPEGAAGM